LISSQHKLVCEVAFVPRAIDQAATLGAVSDGQGRGIRSVQKLLVGLVCPRPCWQRNGHADGFHVAWRHVYDQAFDVAFDHCLKVIADCINVPIVLEVYARFNRRPCALRKLPQ